MQIVRKMMVRTGRHDTREVECMVEMDFDQESTLRYCAEVALRNRTKRTKYGPVTVRVRPTIAEKDKQALSELNQQLSAALFGRR